MISSFYLYVAPADNAGAIYIKRKVLVPARLLNNEPLPSIGCRGKEIKKGLPVSQRLDDCCVHGVPGGSWL
jgi:hypothetical protein